MRFLGRPLGGRTQSGGGPHLATSAAVLRLRKKHARLRLRASLLACSRITRVAGARGWVGVAVLAGRDAGGGVRAEGAICCVLHLLGARSRISPMKARRHGQTHHTHGPQECMTSQRGRQGAGRAAARAQTLLLSSRELVGPTKYRQRTRGLEGEGGGVGTAPWQCSLMSSSPELLAPPCRGRRPRVGWPSCRRLKLNSGQARARTMPAASLAVE